MKIVDLTEEYHKLYFVCLEDWSDELKEAGDHKEKWYRVMKDRGLGVKLALDDEGKVGGMIQYTPIEYAPVESRNKDLYFVRCIWVHGHKQGRGNFQKRGMGKALLQAAEEDVKARGAKGLVAWGLILPFFMKASWFKKHGYQQIDRMGMQALLWKPFGDGLTPPKWTKPKKQPEQVPGKVTVTALISGWCPAQGMAFERAKRASAEIGDKVVFRGINTLDKANFAEWGISDALYIDGKEMPTGPPPSYEKIKKAISSKAGKIK